MHNQVMMPDTTKMSSTGHMRDWNAVVRQVPGHWEPCDEGSYAPSTLEA